MILAYWQVTRDTAWVEKYFDILTQWTTFLIEDGLIPAHQLSTDDFAGKFASRQLRQVPFVDQVITIRSSLEPDQSRR